MKENKISVMTLEEALDTLEPELSVFDDVYDYEYPTWCGARFTDLGKTEFEELLDLEVEVGEEYICVRLYQVYTRRGDEYVEHLHDRLQDLFCSMAGYCAGSQYDVWFVEEVTRDNHHK